jgi:hypothetical protein
MLEGLAEDLPERGDPARLCKSPTEVRALLERSGVQAALGDGSLFPTLKSAVDACDSGGFAAPSEAGIEPF